MTSDQVTLGAALAMFKRYGDQAPLKVAERIGELAVDGDEMGVAVWTAIAGRMEEILRSGASH